MKIMLPVLYKDLPESTQWAYEVKYDGFRAQLHWSSHKQYSFISRTGKDLSKLFPEIIDFLSANDKTLTSHSPFLLDGEISVLGNDGKSLFSEVQKRGRMRSANSIQKAVILRPVYFLAFDLLIYRGSSITDSPYEKRKKKLEDFFQEADFPTCPTMTFTRLLQSIPSQSRKEALHQVLECQGEGIVAKHKKSKWEKNRSNNWVKWKNWRLVKCFITGYNSENQYYDIGVFKGEEVYKAGSFLHGLGKKDKEILNQIIKKNGYHHNKNMYAISPSICVEVNYLERGEQELREPYFNRFLLDSEPEECTYEQMLLDEIQLPQNVPVTSIDKPLWSTPLILKMDYLRYMREIAPLLLPYLKGRLLTVIRYPHGMYGESFYQKQCPDYAPEYVQTSNHEGTSFIVCNSAETLLWLSNQLAIEYHVPFQTVHSDFVSEIVFDLDPPSREFFSLAVKAAKELKRIFDTLQLTSFVKFSGNKGLQVYLPLEKESFTWEDTEQFNSFIAAFLVKQSPELFTIERLKKNRGNKLYVDYIQHRKGKTIIAPYSLRGNQSALVAAPLFWEEVEEGLDVESFTMEKVIQRIKRQGCPFSHFFETNNSSLKKIITDLKSTGHVF
ncbi:DNA ligase D [Bacillus sp. FJAT-44742]|uniref:DNA ligase D n=1 Tax=Bacillus sp. FJAT-44742 TaxID=2014005 RepID=UPI000C248BF9|nr:DNA ligase D [Bacillus sp. FJAT-44742]